MEKSDERIEYEHELRQMEPITLLDTFEHAARFDPVGHDRISAIRAELMSRLLQAGVPEEV